MAEKCYYSNGKCIPITELAGIRVLNVRDLGEGRTAKGWQYVPLEGNYALLIADVISGDQDSSVGSRIEQLSRSALAVETAMREEGSAISVERLEGELGTAGAPAVVERNGGILLPTGTVLVKLKKPSDVNEFQAILQQRGAAVVKKIRLTQDTFEVRPKRPNEALALSAEIFESGIAAFSTPNFIEEMPDRAMPR